MKALQARKLLATAPVSTTEYSKVNCVYTQKEIVGIVLAAVNWHHSKGAKVELSPILEKRVHQVVNNQKKPRYDRT